jgi:hypothetical protein
MVKRYKWPGIDQIVLEFIQEGDKILRSEIHKLINSTWNEEELSQQLKESITLLFTRAVTKPTVRLLE